MKTLPCRTVAIENCSSERLFKNPIAAMQSGFPRFRRRGLAERTGKSVTERCFDLDIKEVREKEIKKKQNKTMYAAIYKQSDSS